MCSECESVQIAMPCEKFELGLKLPFFPQGLWLHLWKYVFFIHKIVILIFQLLCLCPSWKKFAIKRWWCASDFLTSICERYKKVKLELLFVKYIIHLSSYFEEVWSNLQSLQTCWRKSFENFFEHDWLDFNSLPKEKKKFFTNKAKNHQGTRFVFISLSFYAIFSLYICLILSLRPFVSSECQNHARSRDLFCFSHLTWFITAHFALQDPGKAYSTNL